MRASPSEQMERMEVAERAVLIQDQARIFQSQQALTDYYQNKLLGVPLPEDEMIHVGDVNNTQLPPASQQKRGLSPLMGGLIGAGLLATGLGAGVGGLLIADAIKNIKPASTVVAPVTLGDGNTKYQLKLLP